jgi:hypothetical protein
MAKRNPNLPPLGQLITIATLLVALVALMLLKSRCGNAVEQMFRAIEAPGSVDAGARRDGGDKRP